MKTLIFTLFLLCFLSWANSSKYFLYEDFSISSELKPNIPTFASAIFEDNLSKTGWLNIKITTNGSYSDDQQMFAAGNLEGYLTQNYIFDAYNNFVDSVLNKNAEISNGAKGFINDQLNWINSQTQTNGSNYWRFVKSLMAQLDGMYQGYQKKVNETGKSEESLDFFHFYYLTNMGDLEDIIPAFDTTKMKDPLFKECSGFIKLDEDLITSHNTHNIYSLMLRIFKTYNFKLGNPSIKNNIVSYSARPGDLESKDDFYVLGQSFAVIESSLNNYNKTMYSFIQKESLPVWIRVNIANKFASSAKEWVDLFTMYNSGTHNNQWAVVDYELYWSYILQEVPQEDWKDLVWLVEQFFFIADKMDVTQEYLVRDNYFATYNFPYHKEIFDLGNYSINNPHDPREDIIRNKQGNVHTVDDVKKLILLNNNETGDPCGGIAPRCDLKKEGAQAFGAIDGKVTSGHLLINNTAWIYSSPSHDNLPAFDFKNFEGVPHRGIPEVMNFDWQMVSLI